MQLLRTIVLIKGFSSDQFSELTQTCKTEIYHYCNFHKTSFEKKSAIKRGRTIYFRAAKVQWKISVIDTFRFNANCLHAKKVLWLYGVVPVRAAPVTLYERRRYAAVLQFENSPTRFRERTSFTISRALFASDRSISLPLNKANRFKYQRYISPFALHRTDVWRITFRIPDA